MKIALIASARFPVREPFAGGLEAQTWSLVRGLKDRGHEVLLYAAPGSDAALQARHLAVRPAVLSDAARADVSSAPDWWMQEHHAYLSLMLALAREDADVIHNNSLHYLPVAMASTLSARTVSTLHTPPTAWLESAIQAADQCPVSFAAVSEHTARAWRHVVPDATVVRNGIDVQRWAQGPGGGAAVWSGRIVPEKGTHLAVQAAARAGMPVKVAGPVLDRAYFVEAVEPWLRNGSEYLGHLKTDELARLVGQACVSLVTPCWEEPYGLVVAESLSCGTPVAGFARGALPELVGPRHGRLVASDPEEPAVAVDALAAALVLAAELDRDEVRAHAVATCSVGAMIDGYELLYAGNPAQVAAA